MSITLRGAAAVLYHARDDEILLEGRAGTGKSIGACKKVVDCAYAYPGAHILLCRQTRESMSESILVTLESVIGDRHPEVTRMQRQNRSVYHLNGSQIVCAGLDEPAKAFGTGWDLIYLNEGIEASLNAWELFGRAARDPRLKRKGDSQRMPYRQHIMDLNPGAPSHWANQRATPAGNHLRAVNTYEDWLRLDAYNSGPQDGTMRRLISVHQDNPAFFDVVAWKYNEDGITFRERKLGKMSGHNRQRMLNGLWCVAEGSVFPNFSDELDTGNVWRTFNPPAEWPMYWGIDPGMDHPAACLWFTVAPNETLIVCAEIVISGKGTDELAPMITSLERVNGWHNREITRYGDPQYSFSSTAMSKKTIAEQYREHGIILHPWPRTGDNMDGMVDAVRSRINAKTLVVMDNSPLTIAALQSWSFRRNADGSPAGAKGKDAYEESYKDACDVVRGLVALNPRQSPPRFTL